MNDNKKELNSNEIEKVTGGIGRGKVKSGRKWAEYIRKHHPEYLVLAYGGPKPFDIKDLEKRIKRKPEEEPKIEELPKE